MSPSHPPSSVKASLRFDTHRGPRRIVSPGSRSKSAIACFRMCGYTWVFHCREGSSREPIRENDPLDRQSLYTGTKYMTVSKARGMPKGCCGKSFLFQWVGYEYFRLSDPTAIFPLFAAVLSSKTEKIFTSKERKGENNEKHFAVYFDRSCCGADAVRLLLQPLLLPLSGRIPISQVTPLAILERRPEPEFHGGAESLRFHLYPCLETY